MSDWNDQQGPSDPTGGDGGTGEPAFPSWTAPGASSTPTTPSPTPPGITESAPGSAAAGRTAPFGPGDSTSAPGHTSPDATFRPSTPGYGAPQGSAPSYGTGEDQASARYRPGDQAPAGDALHRLGGPEPGGSGFGGQPQPWELGATSGPVGHVPAGHTSGTDAGGFGQDGRGPGTFGPPTFVDGGPTGAGGSPYPGVSGYVPQPGGPYPTGVPQLWPGPIPLRPMDFGEILEAAFRVVRFNPRTLIGLSVAVLMLTSVVALGGAFIVASLTGALSSPMSDGDGGLGVQLASYAPSLVSALLSGVLIVPIAEAALGRKITGSESWARAKGRMPSLIGYGLLTFLIGLAILIPLLGLVVWSAVSESATAIVSTLLIGAPLAIAAIMFLSTKLSLAPAAIVLEGLGPVAGMRRSWLLTRGAFWRTFFLELVISLIVSTIVGILGVVLAFVVVAVVIGGVVASGGQGSEPSGFLLFVILALVSLLSSVMSAFVQPLSSASIALVYLDRRFRTEALAVDLLAEAERQRASGHR